MTDIHNPRAGPRSSPASRPARQRNVRRNLGSAGSQSSNSLGQASQLGSRKRHLRLDSHPNCLPIGGRTVSFVVHCVNDSKTYLGNSRPAALQGRCPAIERRVLSTYFEKADSLISSGIGNGDEFIDGIFRRNGSHSCCVFDRASRF